MASQAFLLPISTLVTQDDLPQVLVDLLPSGFLDSVLGSIFYRDLQTATTPDGDTSFYSMTLAVGTKLEIDIAGSGFKLVVNPDAGGVGADKLLIPFSLSYQWKLLKFLRGFDTSTFSFDADGINDILHRVLPISVEELLSEAVGLFVQASMPPGTTLQAAIQQFVLNVNAKYSQTPALQVTNGTPENMILELVRKVEAHAFFRSRDINIARIIYDVLLADADKALERISQLYRKWAGDSVLDLAKDFLLPKITATARFKAGLEIPSDILAPADPVTHELIPNAKAVITFGEADVVLGTETGIRIDTDIAVSVPFSKIGKTDFYVAIQNAKLDLSRTSNIAEVSGDGRPPEFIGAYVERVEIDMFGGDWARTQQQKDASGFKLVGRKMIVGTGGVSGTITFEPIPGNNNPFHVSLFGFDLALKSFDVQLSKNEIVHCSISGTLTLPKVTPEANQPTVDILIGYNNGAFMVTATPHPPISIVAGEIFTLRIDSLSVGGDGGRFYLAVSGVLDITASLPPVGRLIDKPIEIRRLVIWSNGRIDFEGGSIVLPTSVSLKLGPVELSVSNIHLGGERAVYLGVPRDYKYIGFDGGINTVVGGVDTRGDGVKFYFTNDGLSPSHTYLRISGIRIDLHIPGDMPREEAALLLEGFIAVQNGSVDHPVTEYSGGVKFRLPKIGLGGGAAMKLTPATGAFIVDAHLDLSSPILLGSTGLGIYGFRGLFGNKYVLEEPKDMTWWEYYKKQTVGFGIDKFTQDDGVSIGAGVSIATVADSGTGFSAKVGFILSLPDVLVLQGQAAILSKRVSIDSVSDPPFFALFALSRKGVQAAFGVKYRLPDAEPGNPDTGGEILKLDAVMELAFFFGNAAGWYINIGRDTPEEKRISAKILKILNGWAYLMLSSSGIRAGAGVSLKLEKDLAIAKVGIGASMEVGGKINFRPAQIGAWLRLAGYAELKVFGIGFRLNVEATLRAEAPHPFIIAGDFRVELDLPWPIPNIGLTVSLSWEFDPTLNLDEIGFMEPNVQRQRLLFAADAKHPAKAVHMMSGETFPLNFVLRDYARNMSHPAAPVPGISAFPHPAVPGDPEPPGADGQWVGDFENFIVPVDCFIDLEFTKGVKPNDGSNSVSKLGPIQTGLINYEDVPPQPGHSPQVRHEYWVDEVNIYYWSPSASNWLPYEMELANSPLRRMLSDLHPELLSNAQQFNDEVARRLKYGSWQLTEPDRYTKLRILGRSPLQQNPDVPPTELGFPPTVLLCPPSPIELTCLNWEDVGPGTGISGDYAANQRVFDRKLAFQVTTEPAAVVARSGFGLQHTLQLKPGNRIEIYFPEPVTSVHLKMATDAPKATFSWYLGYPSGPSTPADSGGSRPNSWDPAPVGPSAGGGNDSFWEKMRQVPRFARTFCSGAGGPDLNAGPVAALDARMKQKFAKTNYFLRPFLGLTAAATDPTFCQGLREMLGTVVVSIAGKDRPPTVLQQNVDLFYLDAKRYTQQYESLVEESGGALPAPPAAANEFYEKWLDLVVCLGTLIEKRGTYAGYVRSMITALLEPEVERLHLAVITKASSLQIRMNQPPTVTDTLQRMRAVAEFFALLTLDLSTIDNDTLDLRDVYYQPLFAPIEDAVRRVRAAVAGAGADPCGTSGGVMQGCSTNATAIGGIPRLLCYDTDTGEESVQAIALLLADFDQTVVDMEARFGLNATTAAGSLCPDLRRALRVVAIALPVLAELPGELRVRVSAFYDALIVQVDRYRHAVQGQDRTGPDEQVDGFVQDWLEAAECLCSYCKLFGTLGADEAYFRARTDALYAAITDDVLETGLLVYGSHATTDRCEQTASILALLTGLSGGCANVPGAVQTYLNDNIAAFEAALTTFRNGKLATYRAVICDGGAQSTDCAAMVDKLRCLYSLVLRRHYLPESILDRIVDDLSSTLWGILGIVNALEHSALEFNGIIILPLSFTPIELVEFYLYHILRNITPLCLSGGAFTTTMAGQLAGSITSLASAYASLETALEDLPEEDRVTICAVPGTDPVALVKTLLENQRSLCNTAPTAQQLAASPLADIITLMQDNAAIFNEAAAVLGLAGVPATWPSSDFCSMVARYLEILTVAFGERAKLSPHEESVLRTFHDDLQPLVAAYGGSSAASGACQTLVDRWLVVFRCLARVCSLRGFLPGDVFTDQTGGLEGAFGSLLDGAYTKMLAIADRTEVAIQSGRPVDLCRKLRTIATYVTVRGLDYAQVTATDGLQSVIESFNDLRDMVLGRSTRPRLCPPPNGAYDPLKKRETKTRAELGQMLVYENQDAPIDRLVIAPATGCDAGLTPPCNTYLYEICWLAEADRDYNDSLPDPVATRKATNDTLVSLKEFTQPIWRPNTYYAIDVKVSEHVRGRSQPYVKYYTFGFRTAGPIGHFHQIGTGIYAPGTPGEPRYHPDYQRLIDEQRETEYKYASLKHYIDFDRSYPNADGNIINAKPLYYGRARLSVYYRLDYIESMYGVWNAYGSLAQVNSGLKTVVRDPSKPADEAIVIEPRWEKDPDPRQPKEFRVFKYMLQNRPQEDCVQFNPLEQLDDTTPPPARRTVAPMTLEPRRLYTAQFIAVFGEQGSTAAEREVHTYVFQTSRYVDFPEHINSYLLPNPDGSPIPAVYQSVLPAASNVTAARQIIEGTIPDTQLHRDLAAQYPLMYDRLMDGALRLSDLPSPTTTEFTVVRESALGPIVGILVRSPEPFNDPRLDDIERAKGLTLTAGFGAEADRRVIFSKDMTAIFISTATGTVDAGAKQITFEYRLYNGTQYAQATELVPSGPGYVEQPVLPITATITV